MTLLSDSTKGAMFMMGAMLAITVAETFIKATGGALPIFQLLFLRGVATTILLLPLATRRVPIKIPRGLRDRFFLVLRNIGEAAAAFFYLAAILQMPLADAKAILQILPFWLTLGGFVFFGQPVGWRRLAAIAIGFLGVMLIIRPSAEGISSPMILVLISTLFATLRDLSTRGISPKVNSMTITFSANLTVMLLAGIASAFVEWRPVTWPVAGLILGAGISIIFGYVCLVQSMRQGQIAFVVLFRYTGLVWALLLGYVVFSDWPDPITLVGAALIVGTGIFTIYRESPKREPRRDSSGPKEPLG